MGQMSSLSEKVNPLDVFEARMQKVVLSLGGSVLIPGERDAQFIRSLANRLSPLAREYEMIVVCGGGKVARYYIQSGRELGVEKEQLDLLGIEVTRLNARLLQLALGERAVPTVPEEVEEATRLAGLGKIVVMGGTFPGHTTDAVAAMVAVAWKADRIVNATSVDAVYSEDPRKVSEARRYSRLSFQELYEIVDRDHDAGQTTVFDRTGADIAMRASIPIYVVLGRDLEELERAIRDLEIKGTKISNEER
jgi:uridylate kinase